MVVFLFLSTYLSHHFHPLFNSLLFSFPSLFSNGRGDGREEEWQEFRERKGKEREGKGRNERKEIGVGREREEEMGRGKGNR